MQEVILVHYGELALKQSNRGYFEKRLVQNIREACQDVRGLSVRKLFGRFILHSSGGNTDWPIMQSRLGDVFGIAWFGRAIIADLSWQALLEACDRALPDTPGLRFGVKTKKSENRWPKGATETSRDLGAWIVERRGFKVDLTSPDIWVRVEIFSGQVLVTIERFEGRCGLPVGTSGRALCLLSGGIDSPVAAYRMLSRGCRILMVHFHSFPHTTRESQDKVIDLVKELNRYQPSIVLHMVPFAECQRELVVNTPPRLRVVLYRRFMMRIADAIAEATGCEAVVSGEALGQVASQTLANLQRTAEAGRTLLLRPLIGHDKDEIVALARRAGTFDISTRPHEDCCTYLMPKKPAIAATAEEIAEAEAAVDVDRLVSETLSRIEAFKILRGEVNPLRQLPEWARGAPREEERLGAFEREITRENSDREDP